MKEVTEIYTVQVTMIGECEERDADRIVEHKERAEKEVAEWVKKRWGADDATVVKQVFIRDLEGTEE